MLHWGWIVLLVILFVIILPLFLLTYIIYDKLLCRSRKLPRERRPSFPEDELYMRMYEGGNLWREQNAACRTDVTLERDGLKLVGEYYDFGCREAVIIQPGRTEPCIYSAYFAAPYRAAGCNVLIVDNRAHGLSDGRRNTLGAREHRDLLAWCRLLHDRYGNEGIWLHGVCIGASTCLKACTSPEKPEYLRGMAAEGMYRNFYITTRNHMIESKRPIFPFLYFLMAWIHIMNGESSWTDGPFKRIRQMQLPLLMLHSREDAYSAPALAQEMFDSCPSPKKTLHWFAHGGHSRVRYVNPEEYDRAVLDFVQANRPAKEVE